MEKNSFIDTIYGGGSRNLIQINNRFQALVIVLILAKMFMFSSISSAHAIKYFLVVFVAVFFAVSAEFLYHLILDKRSIKDSISIMTHTYPQLDGLVVGAALNYGYHLQSVAICTFSAIIIAKMLYGGYNKNIFSAPAFTIVLIHSAYQSMTLNLSMNGKLDSILLAVSGTENDHHIVELTNLKDAFIANKLPYLSISTLLSTILFVVFFIIAFKLVSVDLYIPIRIFLILFILSYTFIGFLNGTAHINSSILYFNNLFNYLIKYSGAVAHFFKSFLLFYYLIVGPTIIGIILFVTYPSAMPKEKTSKYIVAFTMAIIVFYTKIFTTNPFGIFYGILLANALTPMLDEIVVCSKHNKNITIIIISVLSFIIGFISFLLTMKGV